MCDVHAQVSQHVNCFFFKNLLPFMRFSLRENFNITRGVKDYRSTELRDIYCVAVPITCTPLVVSPCDSQSLNTDFC